MRVRSPHIPGGLAIVLMVVLLVGCGPTSNRVTSGWRSTRYRPSDIRFVTETMADRLAGHPFLAGRSPDAPRLRLVPAARMENRSSERISRTDQWATMALVLLDPNMLELLRTNGIDVLMPPERMQTMRSMQIPGAERAGILDPDDQATHVFHAVFSSMTRGADVGGEGVMDQRKDLFVVEFYIVEMSSGRRVWSETMELSRVADGVLID